MASLKKIFNYYNQVAGKIFSDVNFDFYRPDYTSPTQAATLIASNKSVRFDTRAAQWAEPFLSEGMYYDLFLNRKIVQPGDILVPVPLTYTASSWFQHPIITVESISAVKPCVGLLTDHIGEIRDGPKQSRTLYTNVRWQWAAIGQPKRGALNKNPIEDLFPFDRRKAIMFRRQGIGLPTPLKIDMQLVEKIDGIEVRWRIIDIMSTGSFTILQVEVDSR